MKRRGFGALLVAPAALLFVAGAVLLALSLAEFPLLAVPARILSEDGQLSAVFIRKILKSQQLLGLALAVLSPIALLGDNLVKSCSRVLLSPSPVAFHLMVGALSFSVAWCLQTILFGGIPHVTDAISHIFQAKILQTGGLYVPSPPCYEHFFQHNIFITADGRWFSTYPPGHALTLAAFMKVGMLSLAGPFCFAVTACSIMHITMMAYDILTSRIVGLFLILSPLMQLLAGSFMSHTSFMAYAACGIALLLPSTPRAAHVSVPRSLLAGLALGMCVITRPQDGFLIAVILLIALVLVSTTWRHHLIKSGAIAFAGFLLPLSAMMYWNNILLGSPLALGYGRTSVDSLTPLLVPGFGFSDQFTARDALQQTVWTLTRFDKALLGWPTALCFALLAFIRWPADRRDVVCASAVVLVVGFHHFYAYYGAEYEARFYSVATPFALVLVIRALFRSRQLLSRVANMLSKDEGGRHGQALVFSLSCVFFAHGALYYWPHVLIPRYAKDYEQVSPTLGTLAKQHELRNALVLMHAEGDTVFEYSSGFIHNDPHLNGRVIYARDLDGKIDCLRQAFPKRMFYRYVKAQDGSPARFDVLETP